MGASELENTIIGNVSERVSAKASGKLECWLEGNTRVTGAFPPTMEATKPSLR